MTAPARLLLDADALIANWRALARLTELLPPEKLVMANGWIEGLTVGSIVVTGEAELGFQQISELCHVEGIDYIGPLPPDVQHVTMFSSGIVAGAKEADAARALVKFITSPAVAYAYKKRGMEPG